MIKDYDIPGVSIAIIEEGKPSWSKSYGYADLKKR